MMFPYNLLIRNGKGGKHEKGWNTLMQLVHPSLPLDEEAQRKNQRVEAWLRGFISFTDFCTLNGWEAAERRARLEGLGITLPEWNERAKPLAWTKQAPTEAGYYWLHDHVVPGRPRTFMVYFKDRDNVRVHGGAWLPSALMTLPECWWAGPILHPVPPHHCGRGVTCDQPGCINCPPQQRTAEERLD